MRKYRHRYLDPFEGKLGQRIFESRIEANEHLDIEQQAAIDRLPFTVVRATEYRKLIDQGKIKQVKPGFYALWDKEKVQSILCLGKHPDGSPVEVEISSGSVESNPCPDPGKWENPQELEALDLIGKMEK